jgi:regulator of ribosome biosynthesis
MKSPSISCLTLYRPTSVSKPIPFTFDLGNLLAIDSNPLPAQLDENVLQSTARDAAQAIINQLLTTCEVISTTEGVLLHLPATTTALPRQKPVPTEKLPTKWELFAKKKGIKNKKQRNNMVYDEAQGEWVPRWGYRGKNKEVDDQWLVEVDENKERRTGVPDDPRGASRAERKERIKRNERRMRANEARSMKGSKS